MSFDKMFLQLSSVAIFGFLLSNGHSPQIHETRSLLVRMCQGESHFSQKWPLASVRQVWQVRAKQVGECWRVWRVRATRLCECLRVWRVLAKPLDKCWLKQDRLFYAQITYFICIKRSSLHSLYLPNLTNSLNSCKTCQTCLS